MRQAISPLGNVQGRRAVITAGTGPVGMRAAGLLAQAGADVLHQIEALENRGGHAHPNRGRHG